MTLDVAELTADGPPDEPAPPVLRLAGLRREFESDPPVVALDDVELTVAGGEYLAIVGPSGSGKSTLLNVLGLLDRPTAGVYELDGIDTGALSDRERAALRAERIGFVFQSFNLRGDSTALENVMMPLLLARMKPKDRKARAATCLEQMGLADRMGHLPSQLSGGQRQRVAIARALANQPGLLIADEPTGNLDSNRGEEVLQLLAGLSTTGITLLVITHDQRVAARGHRTIEVLDGKVREDTEARP